MIPPQSRPLIDVPDDHEAAPVFQSRRVRGAVVEADLSAFYAFDDDVPPDTGWRGPGEVCIAPMPGLRSNGFDRTHPVLEWVAIFVAVFGFGLFLGAGAIVLGGDLALILWGAP